MFRYVPAGNVAGATSYWTANDSVVSPKFHPVRSAATFAAATGLVLGTLAAGVGIAGFVHGHTGSLRLDSTPYLAIVVLVLALTWSAGLAAARRSLAVPLSDAVGPSRG